MRKAKKGLLLSVLFLLITLAIAIGAGVYAHRVFSRNLSDQWKQQMNFATEMTTNNLENYFWQLSGALLIQADNPQVSRMLLQNDPESHYCPLEYLYTIYKDKVNAILLLDTSNRVIKRYPMLDEGKTLLHCPEPLHPLMSPKTELVLSDVFLNKRGNPTVSLSCPVVNEGRHLGYVKWVIALEKLSSNLLKELAFSKQSKIIVFDQSTHEVLIPPQDDPTIKNFNLSILDRLFGLKDREHYGVEILTDAQGKNSLITGYHRLKLYGNEWIVCVVSPYEELAVAVRNNALLTALIAALTTFFLSLISINFIRLNIQRDNALTLARHNSELAIASEALHNERKLRLKAAIDAREAEQKRISRELHDGLGQLLLATRLKLEDLRADANDSEQNITKIILIIDRALSEVKSISYNLHPPIFNDFGIDKVMEQLCRESGSSMGCKVDYVGYGTENIHSSLIKSYIYRICQEALANAIRHSGAFEVNVQLLCTIDHATLIVQDNGSGFDMNFPGLGGNGIANMRDRVGLMNGIIEFESFPNAGTTLNVRIPLTDNDE